MKYLKSLSESTLLFLLFIIVAIACIAFDTAHAAVNPDVQFAPASNWYEWVVRQNNETGRGQTFMTPGTMTAVRSVGMKVCRIANFTKPKTLTLCSAPASGWLAGCQTPLATKVFSASALNSMIPYDANCGSGNEGGATDGVYFKWVNFTFDNAAPVNANTSYFFLLNSGAASDTEANSVLVNMYNNCSFSGPPDYTGGQTHYYKGANKFSDPSGAACDMLFKVYGGDPNPPIFAITSPTNNGPEVRDTWITVSGTCPIAGANRIGLTNDCNGFANIKYDLACTAGQFGGKFYYDGLGDKRIIARDKSSSSSDCVAYDDLMSFVTVRNIEIIHGYPDDWYFNFDYYNDYNIKIKSPVFDNNTLTLSAGSTAVPFTFQFTYPASSTVSNLQFTIKQYKPDGTLLNGAYHVKNLADITDRQNYQVNLAASSTTPLHYVVLLTESGETKRQYPFSIYVSDMVFVANADATDFFFPRIVEELKKKIVFNYFFAFHDGFANLFNTNATAVSSTALDITFKSVSDNGQYNIEIPIFSASNPIVKSFTAGVRPYVTAVLWLLFAMYVLMRVSHVFSGTPHE